MQDAEKGKETKVSSSNLGDHDQPSCQTEISEIHDTPNLPAECLHSLQVQVAEEIGRADDQMPVEQDMEMLPTLAVEDMKNGGKVARLAISVSTTGIVSFLSSGVPRGYSSMTSKLIFKSGILLMFASLLSALVLLVLSTNNAKLSCSNRSLRIISWVSTGLMTLALVLFMAFYLLT